MEDLSRREKAALRDQRHDLREALAHEPTRRLIRRLIDSTGVFRVDSGDPFAAGQRSVGLGLIAEMNEIDVHAFPRLMQEGANEVVKRRNEERTNV